MPSRVQMRSGHVHQRFPRPAAEWCTCADGVHGLALPPPVVAGLARTPGGALLGQFPRSRRHTPFIYIIYTIYTIHRSTWGFVGADAQILCTPTNLMYNAAIYGRKRHD